MKRIPIFATLLVLIAVSAMVKFGFWQLARADEKEAMLTRYASAAKLPAIAFPAVSRDASLLFRKAGGMCLEPVEERIESGRNLKGATGWRHIIACRTGAEGPGIVVDIGWSRDFKVKSGWRGGPVEGVITLQPDHRSIISRSLGNGAPPGLMLVARVPALGLQASAPPALAEIPNNHLSYAVQWFLFAGIAALIYAIAVSRRMRA
jgi:surfeit locus 1 family protein